MRCGYLLRLGVACLLTVLFILAMASRSLADSSSVMATGSAHTLAVKSDGSRWAWGYNEYGQLGFGDTTNREYPLRVGTDTDWQAVDAGASHSMAVKSDGTLWA